MTTQNMTDNFAGGKAIIQVVMLSGGGSSTTSTTPVDITGTSVSITPTSSSNKIIVMASLEASAPSSTDNTLYIQCLRGAGVINGTPFSRIGNVSSSISVTAFGVESFIFVDAPATTSPTTYKLQQYASTGSVTITTANVNILLIEVVA